MGRAKGSGKTPGSGKRAGHKSATTLDKLMARELLRQQVTAKLGPLVEAQIANALGLRHFVLRDKKSGRFERVTDPDRIVAAMNDESAESWEVWEKDPNIQAFTDLMNRAIDKPREQQQNTNVHSTMTISWENSLVEKLAAGRERARGIAAAKNGSSE
jgi:hypothetical protein